MSGWVSGHQQSFFVCQERPESNRDRELRGVPELLCAAPIRFDEMRVPTQLGTVRRLLTSTPGCQGNTTEQIGEFRTEGAKFQPSFAKVIHHRRALSLGLSFGLSVVRLYSLDFSQDRFPRGNMSSFLFLTDTWLTFLYPPMSHCLGMLGPRPEQTSSEANLVSWIRLQTPGPSLHTHAPPCVWRRVVSGLCSHSCACAGGHRRRGATEKQSCRQMITMGPQCQQPWHRVSCISSTSAPDSQMCAHRLSRLVSVECAQHTASRLT